MSGLNFRKPPIAATIMMLCGVLILCSLGYWQYQRLLWKTEILQQMDAEGDVNATQIAFLLNDFLDDVSFRKGYVRGLYDHDNELRLQARTYDGESGYHIYTPFYLLNDPEKVLLVNRGWVPLDHEMPEQAIFRRPNDVIKIVGALKNVSAANMFVPENKPDEDVWYKIDLDQIGAAKNIKFFSNKILYIEGEGDQYIENPDIFPKPATLNSRPNNNHAQYMMFWLSMAVVLVVIFFLRFVALKAE